MITQPEQPDLDALKAAHAEAKAVRREAMKALLDAKRVADAARWRVGEAFRAYNAARRYPTRPRPPRTVNADEDPDWPFAPSEPRGEVA